MMRWIFGDIVLFFVVYSDDLVMFRVLVENLYLVID